MKFSISAIALVAAASVIALPARRDGPSDADILNYALTLEHLENAFYKGALEKFDADAFKKAGFEPFVRGRFQQIVDHEATHVQFLSDALGDKATKPCTYKFPYNDPKSFAALSMALEGTGVSAYLGAAKLISNKDYLAAAAAILTTESRHAAWISSSVNMGAPWSGAFDIPLSLNQVYSLAAAFITNCPSSNPPLPVKAFPALTVPTSYMAGDTISVSFDSSMAKGKNTYMAFFTGLTTKFVPIQNGKVTVPKDLMGTVYAVVTTDSKSTNDDNTVAGPAILMFPFGSSVRQQT
ncbi:hypothetical protein FRC09_000161 [Ceratobasidium sp. 395]|nr:hypothetical protein FRC09_000161 [Ceratobasidium sp. 395]